MNSQSSGIIMRIFGFILVILYLFGNKVSCDGASDVAISTTLQLRDSVAFSYVVSNQFLDLIRGNKPPTTVIQVYSNIMSSNSRVTYRDLKPVVTSYIGYGVCAVIGLLFAIFMPLVGFIFCCARCCGKCGGRTHFVDKKKDPCKRVAYAVCLAIIVTFQLAAIVLAFINHYLLHEAITNKDPRIGALSQFNSSLMGFEKSLNEMVQMAKNTSSADLTVPKARFMAIVDDGLRDFQHDFARISLVSNVSDSILELQMTSKDYFPTSPSTVEIKKYIELLDSLTNDLPNLRDQIAGTLNVGCTIDKINECQRLMKQTNEKLKVRFSPDKFQRDEINALSEQIERHLSEIESLSRFNRTIHSLAQIVKDFIEPNLSNAWNNLTQSPETREKLASVFEYCMTNISSALQNLRKSLDFEKNEDVSINYIRAVEFRLYGGIAILCIPILIFLLLYLGLCFGTCGDRPYEEAGLCNRGVGANLLLAGVGFMFLFSTMLMLYCMILFLTGGPLQTEICRYLTGRYPDGPRKFDQFVYDSADHVYKLINSKSSDPRAVTVNSHNKELETALRIFGLNLADAILNKCEKEPFVKAISGGQIAWPILNDAIEKILQEIIVSYTNADLISPLSNTVQSCSDTLELLKFMAAVDFTKAMNQLTIPLTYIDNLEDYISELKSLHVDSLTPSIQALIDGPLALDKSRVHIRDLYVRWNNIAEQHRLTRKYLLEFQKRLPDLVKTTMNSGLVKLRPLFAKELQLAVIATWHDIPCRSLRLAAKGGVDSVCYTILMPYNAFWTGLGFTLLMFIPAIIFAVKLAGLYRKTEKYSSDYEEPDYISYQGFYMRPTSDYQANPQKPRNKARKHKGYVSVPSMEA